MECVDPVWNAYVWLKQVGCDGHELKAGYEENIPEVQANFKYEP